MSKELTDRIALVTGASRGLGYALARALAAPGAHVVAVARTVGGLEELDDEIQGGGGQATLVPLDLTDDPALERLGAALHERWGRLDLWAHTAIYPAGLTPVEHIDVKDLDRTIATNIRVPQRLIRVLDPLLRQSAAGRAVFFTDPGSVDQQYQGTYAMAKAAASEMAMRWGREASATSPLRVIEAAVPPMATALRARFHPGEDTSGHAATSDVADRMITHLIAGAQGRIDLGS